METQEKNEELLAGQAAAVTVETPQDEAANRMATAAALEAQRRKYEEDKLKQNLPMGVIAGLVACLVCATLWAVISIVTGYQIGYMAIGVGMAVGFVVRKVGKGITPTFGIVAAVISVLGCLLGNYFAELGYAAYHVGVNVFELLGVLGFSGSMSVITESFSFIDLIFYALAISAAYKMGYKAEAVPATAK